MYPPRLLRSFPGTLCVPEDHIRLAPKPHSHRSPDVSSASRLSGLYDSMIGYQPRDQDVDVLAALAAGAGSAPEWRGPSTRARCRGRRQNLWG